MSDRQIEKTRKPRSQASPRTHAAWLWRRSEKRTGGCRNEPDSCNRTGRKAKGQNRGLNGQPLLRTAVSGREPLDFSRRTRSIVTHDWQYDTIQNPNQALIKRLRRFPRKPDMLVYGVRSLAALGIRAWLRVYHRMEVIGREHLPAEGSYVLVANHTSHLDAVSLLSALPLKKLHRAFPAASTDYFFTSIPRLAIATVIVNALPFDQRVHFRQSLTLCQQVLADPGNILILFPEGTRSTTGEIGEFKPGIGLLLAGTSVPVLPCHTSGAFHAWPKGRMLPRPGRLRLMIGAPRNYAGFQPGKSAALQICQELRQAVLELAALNGTTR